MKLPLLAALASMATANITHRALGEPVCNTAGVSTRIDALNGFSQSFCLANAAISISHGSTLAQDFSNGDSVVTLSVTNTAALITALRPYGCTTAFGLMNICSAGGDMTRTFGGSYTDGSLVYKIFTRVSAARNTTKVLVPRQIGPETLTCNTASPQKQNHTVVHAVIDKFCQKNLGKLLHRGEFVLDTYLVSNKVTIEIKNECASTLYLPPNVCSENFGMIADCTAPGQDPGFTYGGHRLNECLSFDIGLSLVTVKRDHARDLVAASSSLQRRQAFPQNCINKADPECQIAQWTCTYGSGYTLPQDYISEAIGGLCGTYHGLYMKAGQWFSRTYHKDGHEVWLAIHTSGTKDFLLDINLCSWFFDRIRDQCNTGKGTQGGYDWIPPSGLTFVIGVDGAYNQDSKYCGGYC